MVVMGDEDESISTKDEREMDDGWNDWNDQVHGWNDQVNVVGEFEHMVSWSDRMEIWGRDIKGTWNLIPG